jgi:hypothetical protein
MSNVYITTYHVSLVYVHNIIPKFLKEKGRKVQFYIQTIQNSSTLIFVQVDINYLQDNNDLFLRDTGRNGVYCDISR